MRTIHQTTKALVVAFSTLFALTLILAFVASYRAAPDEQRVFLGLTNWSFGMLISFNIIGELLILLYGVPVFMAMWSRNAAYWPSVLLVGALPGLLFAPVLGFLGIGFGLIVSAAVRMALGRGPGNPFEPAPLRNPV